MVGDAADGAVHLRTAQRLGVDCSPVAAKRQLRPAEVHEALAAHDHGSSHSAGM
jgi:hypothetical protein